MAIYHCSTKPLARSSGRSAVAAAAYRSGDCLVDERQGLEHDYTRRSGVLHTELVLPEGAGPVEPGRAVECRREGREAQGRPHGARVGGRPAGRAGPGRAWRGAGRPVRLRPS